MAKAKLKPHPLASDYPMMTEAELSALADDIKENGLKRAIVLYEGMILDGRNRYIACERAGFEPTFEEYTGDNPMGESDSLNMNRDLTQAQRSIIAARRWDRYEEEAKQRQKDAGGASPGKSASGKSTPKRCRTRESLANKFRTSDKSVQQSKALLIEAPDLVTQVEAGIFSLAAAYEQLQERRKVAKQKEKDAEKVAQYRDAIDAGEMTFEEAIQKAIDEQREQESLEKSEADARNTSLRRIVDAVEWCENFIQGTPEEVFERWFQADSPGTFNHEITQERLTAFSKEVARIVPFAPKGDRNAKRR